VALDAFFESINRTLRDIAATRVPAAEDDEDIVMLTTDPDDPALKKTRADGQQEAYFVAPEEVRRQPAERPYRDRYVHTGVRPKHPTRPLTAEEEATHAGLGYVAYEAYPASAESCVVGRFWTEAQLKGGCGVRTVIGRAIADTYRVAPRTYGATYCCGCGKHFPVEEFTWDDGTTVGS